MHNLTIAEQTRLFQHFDFTNLRAVKEKRTEKLVKVMSRKGSIEIVQVGSQFLFLAFLLMILCLALPRLRFWLAIVTPAPPVATSAPTATLCLAQSIRPASNLALTTSAATIACMQWPRVCSASTAVGACDGPGTR